MNNSVSFPIHIKKSNTDFFFGNLYPIQEEKKVDEVENYEKLTEAFLISYYKGDQQPNLCDMTILFFSHDTSVTIGTETFVGSQYISNKFGEVGIKRLLYKDLNGTSQVLSPMSVLINVNGTCCGQTYWNTFSDVRKFTETFVLKKKSDCEKYYVSNYIFRLS